MEVYFCIPNAIVVLECVVNISLFCWFVACRVEVEFAVDAIGKTLYERTFKWIVEQINVSVDQMKCTPSSFIGILDIAGFEIFQVYAEV